MNKHTILVYRDELRKGRDHIQECNALADLMQDGCIGAKLLQ